MTVSVYAVSCVWGGGPTTQPTSMSLLENMHFLGGSKFSQLLCLGCVALSRMFRSMACWYPNTEEIPWKRVKNGWNEVMGSGRADPIILQIWPTAPAVSLVKLCVKLFSIFPYVRHVFFTLFFESQQIEHVWFNYFFYTSDLKNASWECHSFWWSENHFN